MTVNTFDAVHKTEHAEYRLRNTGAAATAPVDVIVTDPPEMVVKPTPID